MKAEHIVIKPVLDFISKTINVCYEIIEPTNEIVKTDDTEKNKKAPDAVALVGCRKVVIEHTSIDSIPFQRMDDDRFMRVLGPLESELAGKLPTPGHYNLAIHTNVIPTGVDWADVRLKILEWCQKVAPNLEIGDPRTAPRHFVREVPQGVPFEVELSRWPRQDGQLKIARFAPEDTDLENQREEVIYQALISRGNKAAECRAKYEKERLRTMLVLESKDIALANFTVIGQAFVNATKRVDSAQLPDEVYLVETYEEKPSGCSIPKVVVNKYSGCLKFGDAIFPDADISEEPYVT